MATLFRVDAERRVVTGVARRLPKVADPVVHVADQDVVERREPD